MTTTPEALTAALVEHGHQIPLGFAGLVGRGPEFESIIDGIRRRYFAAEDPAKEIRRMTFPPLIPAASFLKTDYLTNFPQLTAQVNVFEGQDKEHRQLIREVEDGEDWHHHFTPSGLMQVPATCENVYPLYAGVLEGEHRVEASSWCLRFEPSDDPLRMVCFRISEQVYLGTEQGAIAHRDEWFANALAMFDDFQLPIDSGRASDPFFGRAGRILANGQLQEGLKHEVRVQLFEDRQTAIASGNLHQTHFAENFGITRPDGSLAHTSCVGFGVERIAIALLVVHGMSTAAWPAGVRGALGL